jgi:hypothetical protein
MIKTVKCQFNNPVNFSLIMKLTEIILLINKEN